MENLSREQLQRRSYVPKLKDSPAGDHPTLESMIRGVADSHLQFHIDHLRGILRELAAVKA